MGDGRYYHGPRRRKADRVEEIRVEAERLRRDSSPDEQTGRHSLPPQHVPLDPAERRVFGPHETMRGVLAVAKIVGAIVVVVGAIWGALQVVRSEAAMQAAMQMRPLDFRLVKIEQKQDQVLDELREIRRQRVVAERENGAR